jgi:hypothetical protein
MKPEDIFESIFDVIRRSARAIVEMVGFYKNRNR